MRYLLLFSLFFSSNVFFGTLPHAYVCDQGNGYVHVIDVSNDTVQKIGGFKGPRVVKVTPDGTQAFVGSDDNTVRVIDTLTHYVLPTVVPVHQPVALAITPNGQFVYVASSNDTVSVIHVGSLTTAAVVTGFNQAHDIKITPDGTKAYVTNGGNGTVSIIDTSTNTIVDTIMGFQSPVGISMTKDGTFAYVTDPNHDVISVIDLSTNAISDTILGLNFPSYIAITPDKALAYVSNSGSDTVSVLRLSDNFVIRTFTIPLPKSIAVTTDGLFVYVGSKEGAVYKVGTFDNNIVSVLPDFHNPSNITLTDNNAPQLTVNGCQTVTSMDIFNTVTWEPAQGLSPPMNYKIYRDAKFTDLAGTVSGATTQFIDSGLMAGQTYEYYVVVNYPSGFSNTIGSVSVSPSRICNP